MAVHAGSAKAGQPVNSRAASVRFRAFKQSMPSTVIRRFAYAPGSRELTIEFVTGRRYVYSAVPQHEVEAMRSAFSKGIFFNSRIRDRYDYRELC